MSLRTLDIIIREVPRDVASSRGVPRLSVLQKNIRFAELAGGGTRLLLRPEALMPIANATATILHFGEPAILSAQIRGRKHGTP